MHLQYLLEDEKVAKAWKPMGSDLTKKSKYAGCKRIAERKTTLFDLQPHNHDVSNDSENSENIEMKHNGHVEADKEDVTSNPITSFARICQVHFRQKAFSAVLKIAGLGFSFLKNKFSNLFWHSFYS